ncbi:MAG: hypothetical protein ACRC62_03520 [Microcoleus sp.]
MSKRNRARGFGGAVVAKNETPPKEISEAVALERLSKEALESLRNNGKVSKETISGNGQSVRVLNEAPAATEETPPEAPEKASTPATLSLSKEELEAVVKMAAEAAVKPLNTQLDEMQAKLNAANAKAEEDKAAIEADKQAALDKLAVFNNLFKLTGNPEPVQAVNAVTMPNANTLINSKSDKPEGALAEFMSIRGPVKEMDGQRFVSTSTPEHKKFLNENLNALINDMEIYCKNNGMFRGHNSNTMSSMADLNAVTTIGDLPGNFLPTLSPILERWTHRPSMIFWQFVNNEVNFEAGNGDTIKVPRAALKPVLTDPNERLLSGGGTYADIVTTRDNLQTGTVDITVKEWGRGAPGSNASPIAITRFVNAFSMMNLIKIMDDCLGYDYAQWEDMILRRLWTPTTRVVYNANNTVGTTPGSVASAASGRLTWQFLPELYGHLRANLVPTYSDGCYGYAIPTKHATQLRASLGQNFQFNNVVDMEALTNIFNLDNAGSHSKVSGYIGKIDNFHIFESNNFSMGAAGTEGVRSEAITGGNAVTRSGYAFGADTIARGIAEPFMLVADEVTNFNRRTAVTWISWQGVAPLDVDGAGDASAVPQQTRVFEVRMTD